MVKYYKYIPRKYSKLLNYYFFFVLNIFIIAVCVPVILDGQNLIKINICWVVLNNLTTCQNSTLNRKSILSAWRVLKRTPDVSCNLVQEFILFTYSCDLVTGVNILAVRALINLQHMPNRTSKSTHFLNIDMNNMEISQVICYYLESILQKNDICEPRKVTYFSVNVIILRAPFSLCHCAEALRMLTLLNHLRCLSDSILFTVDKWIEFP